MKLKKNVKIGLIGILGLLIVFVAYIILNSPKITFNHSVEEIEINQEFDAASYIKKVSGNDIKDVKIDASQVNTHQLGDYIIKYTLGDDEYDLKVKVVDTQAPELSVKSLDVELDTEVDVNQFVNQIKDSTKTKVYYKEDYSFDKEEKKKITIVAEDEAGNKTEKEIEVNVKKDTEKPTLSGLADFTVKKGAKIDYLKNVKAKDNLDQNPTVTVDDSQVNLSKVGTYTITYTVKDKVGNENKYQKKVYVVDNKSLITVKPSENKIVYLTFDDGPSENTKKILDILDKYDAKATFFVTGNGKKYNQYIKLALEKGHTIGLHTYSHNYKKVYSSVDNYFNDLNKLGEMVKKEIGFVPKYIRFPGGSSNTISRKYCKGIMTNLTTIVQQKGYQYYDWNVSSGDASGNNVAVNKIIKESTSSKANNIMLLAHDTRAKSTTVKALPKIIEHYQALGYTFKGIDDTTYTPHHHVNN